MDSTTLGPLDFSAVAETRSALAPAPRAGRECRVYCQDSGPVVAWKAINANNSTCTLSVEVHDGRALSGNAYFAMQAWFSDRQIGAATRNFGPRCTLFGLNYERRGWH